VISSILLAIAWGVGSESDASPAWHVSYAAALAEVRQVDKPLFVLFDGGPSAVVRVVGGSPALHDDVTRALAADYVRMYVDTATESGQKLAAKFGASDLPLAVVVDRSGSWQMYRRSGVPSSTELAGALSEYRRARYGGSDSVRAAAWSNSAARSTSARAQARWYPPASSGVSAAWCRT
jgi:hypothetical protein